MTNETDPEPAESAPQDLPGGCLLQMLKILVSCIAIALVSSMLVSSLVAVSHSEALYPLVVLLAGFAGGYATYRAATGNVERIFLTVVAVLLTAYLTFLLPMFLAALRYGPIY
jgi:hypothetical protein